MTRPRQQIACTRSFGEPVTELSQLLEAISNFATRAAEKARKDGVCAAQILVFAYTSPFSKEEQWSGSATIPLGTPTADTVALVRAAVTSMQRIYMHGHKLAKAGVVLMDLRSANAAQQFQLFDPHTEKKASRQRLMQAVDSVNQRFGSGTLRLACSGTSTEGGWHMKQSKRSLLYTTRFEDVPIAYAN